MRILLGIDGSKASEVSVQALLSMKLACNTEVHIMYVVEIWDVPEWLSAARREMWAEARKSIAHASKKLENAGFQVTTATKEGDPRTILIDAASEWHADLIMVGSHGRTGLNRLLMGSVSEAIARHAPCSVQIVRVPKGEASQVAVRPSQSAKDVGNPEDKTQKPIARGSERHKQVCNFCGKPSSSNICPICADKVRAEAVARKRREDKGEE
jgi:nucleotide-binding universal stress UspA family protein